jgi:DNA helicase-2/ATP-dependent DNA helicase PcrA
MRSILVNQHPFLLVDESQDTNKWIVDGLLAVQAVHAKHFCLGFIGDTMQRIYSDGKEKIEDALPEDWARPTKRLNHRCPKRIVQLINQIRRQVDDHQQEARSDSIEGLVRLFVFPADIAGKPTHENAVRAYMAALTKDADWNEREKCKILTLEHHMAARRMGFATIFETLGSVDDFRTGLLDGTLPATRFFTANVLPLVIARQNEDKFAAAKVVRDVSPLLDMHTIKNAPDQRDQLRTARSAVESLMKLWGNTEPNCGAILSNVAESDLFAIPESLKTFVMRKGDTETPKKATAEAESADPVPEEIAALEKFLATPFSEIAPYARYVANQAEFGTHQGVKGLEFDRVMVLMDDGEARGFMFGYEKFFGAKELTSADIKNEAEGRDNSIRRTRRLFYVTSSRAKKSLALIMYSAAPSSVRARMIANGWFGEDEIVLALPTQS